jgi:predicted nucleic acid-binding protein
MQNLFIRYIYIVTHDKHFNILKTIDFPKVKILTITEFYELLSNDK